MKKLLIYSFALTFAFCMAAFAQSTMGQSNEGQSNNGQMSNEHMKAPLKTLTGTVKSENGKVMFVDENGKSWDVTNPDELKAHEGERVQVRAHVYADKDEIHVMHVKMMKGNTSGEPMSH